MRRKRKTKGFTLVDLMAAVAVASIALAATAAAVTTGATLSRTTTETRAAARASASMMEQVRSTPFDQIATVFDGRTQQLTANGATNSSGLATIEVENVATGSTRWRVLRVTVQTQWKGDAGRTFVTYVCNRTMGTPLGSCETLPAVRAY